MTPNTRSTEEDMPPIQEVMAQQHQETMPLIVPVGEQLCTDYQVHDLPTVSTEYKVAHILLNTGLLAKTLSTGIKKQGAKNKIAYCKCFTVYLHCYHW